MRAQSVGCGLRLVEWAPWRAPEEYMSISSESWLRSADVRTSEIQVINIQVYESLGAATIRIGSAAAYGYPWASDSGSCEVARKVHVTVTATNHSADDERSSPARHPHSQAGQLALRWSRRSVSLTRARLSLFARSSNSKFAGEHTFSSRETKHSPRQCATRLNYSSISLRKKQDLLSSMTGVRRQGVGEV